MRSVFGLFVDVGSCYKPQWGEEGPAVGRPGLSALPLLGPDTCTGSGP